MRTLIVYQSSTPCRRLVSALDTRGMTVQTAHVDSWRDHPLQPGIHLVLLSAEDDLSVNLIPKARTTVGQGIVVVLGDISHAARLQAFELGADDCLPADIPGQELYRHIMALNGIPVAANARDMELTVHDLSIGLMHVDVRRGTRQIRLNKREYQVLRYLGLNADRIISRNELIEHIWGIDNEANENTLDVYIHRLRGKIDKSTSAPALIHTVRGVGYYFGQTETVSDLTG